MKAADSFKIKASDESWQAAAPDATAHTKPRGRRVVIIPLLRERSCVRVSIFPHLTLPVGEELIFTRTFLQEPSLMTQT